MDGLSYFVPYIIDKDKCLNEIDTWAQFYNTFYIRKLQMFAIR
jgi:hypothetical protein